MNKLILGLAVAAAPMSMLPGVALAQDGSAMMAVMFPDPNGDGVTTRDEALAASAGRFAKLDVDKDGKLSEAERSGAPGGRMMGRADTDGDGAISLDEMKAAASNRFDRADTNKDGKIDQAERDAIRERMMQRQGN